MYPYQGMNMLPQQQILQANGKASIDALRLAPNSSVLIADQTQPIIWKCVSDSLGNVTATPFDISPHKDEAQVEKETVLQTLTDINSRLERLEKQYESITVRTSEPTNEPDKVYVPNYARSEKSTGFPSANGFSKPKHETGSGSDSK